MTQIVKDVTQIIGHGTGFVGTPGVVYDRRKLPELNVESVSRLG